MELYMKSLILSIMLGISCKEYYETLLPRRKMRYSWVDKTAALAFVTGFMIISVTPLPSYIFRPVRIIVIVWMIAQIYFKVKWIYNLALSLFFCGIIWVLSSIVVSILQLFSFDLVVIGIVLDPIYSVALFLFMLYFSNKFKGKINIIDRKKGIYFGIFPMFCIIVLMFIIAWDEGITGQGYLFIMGFSIASIFIFAFIYNDLIKDARMQSIQMENELVRNQMSMYRNMEQNYRQQQKYMHDYKNQLNCIQGLLEKEQVKGAIDYIGELTGGIQRSTDYVDTNHVTVNVILNQKYQYAQENGIIMLISVNDLSRLTMKTEDLVALLSNLLDNAIEACKRVNDNKVIWFKMVIEEEDLILSIKNPMGVPFKMEGKRIVSSKKDGMSHGIGLLNVENVVRKGHGSSSIKCKDGYFLFSAMIPIR